MKIARRISHQPYHALLQDTFMERRQRNPSYSLRAFSRDLGISPAALSQVLSYQRALSPKNLQRLAHKLSLSPDETMKLNKRKSETGGRQVERRTLQEDVFRVMSDWYYFGILNLACTPHCKSDAKWIAQRLGINVVQARGAIELLERLGLLRVHTSRLERTSEPLTTTVDIPNFAGRKLQRQHLEIAQKALDAVPLQKRSMTSITMAINPKKIKAAKKLIARFRDELSEFLMEGKQESVYVLAVQLFPLENLKGIH